MPHRPPVVAVIAYQGLCTFEFGCATEVFGLERPWLESPLYTFYACAVGKRRMNACGGITVTAEHGLEQVERADIVIVPGWRDVATPPPPRVLRAIQSAHLRGARIASICTGVAVLAHAGLLNGLRATTHWRYADLLGRLFPEIEFDKNVLYIDHGQIITSAGSAAGLDMCLHIVRTDYGEAVANSIARSLVVAPHREGDQAQFIDLPTVEPAKGCRFARILDTVRAQLDRPVLVRDMADMANMSERSFLRHFKKRMGTSPLRWLCLERVRIAQNLLETTDLNFAKVAAKCGLRSENNLRHQFRKHLNVTPGQYRQRFRAKD